MNNQLFDISSSLLKPILPIKILKSVGLIGENKFIYSSPSKKSSNIVFIEFFYFLFFIALVGYFTHAFLDNSKILKKIYILIAEVLILFISGILLNQKLNKSFNYLHNKIVYSKKSFKKIISKTEILETNRDINLILYLTIFSSSLFLNYFYFKLDKFSTENIIIYFLIFFIFSIFFLYSGSLHYTIKNIIETNKHFIIIDGKEDKKFKGYVFDLGDEKHFLIRKEKGYLQKIEQSRIQIENFGHICLELNSNTK